MANPRLTNEIRRKIKRHLLSDKFTKDEEAVKKKRALIGPRAYIVKIPKKIRDAIESFPNPDWFSTENHIEVAIDGELEYYYFGRDGKGNRLERAFEDADYTSENRLSLNSREDYRGDKLKLFDLIKSVRAEESRIKKEKRKAEIDIDAVLFESTTRKKLISNWPEIEATLDRIWPLHQEVKPTKALAVQMCKLNETLGLPEVKKAS